MQITIVTVEDISDLGERVSFRAQFGAGAGTWRGADTPRPGEIYQIELTVMDALEVGRNAELDHSYHYALAVASDMVTATIFVERLDPDRVAYLRLGSDCLFLAEVAGSEIVAGQWLRASIPVERLELYPYDSGSFAVFER